MKLFLSAIALLLSAHLVSAQSCTITFTTLDSLPDGSIWVTAHLTGTSPTYVWSNGATGATIEVTAPGAYLVTATNAEGCSIGSGYVAECETRVRQEGNGFTAYKLLGGTGLTYLWNTGETTQTIYPTQSDYYCVTVTGSNNCADNSICGYFYANTICSVNIAYNSNNTLTANGTGTPPYSYHWWPGNYDTQTIDPGQPGNYSVTITDATGCTSYNAQYLFDPLHCAVDVYFSSDSSSNGGGWLFAETVGTGWAVMDYQWSNGGNDSATPIGAGGSYCVTVTNTQTGCSASNCYWYWPDSTCYAQIHVDSIGLNEAFLSVAGGPVNIVDYQWNNGGTGPVNTITAPGWQSVNVTNSNGCTASTSIYMYGTQSVVVNVEIADSTALGNNGVHALVYLIRYDTAQGGILTAVDTVETLSWSNSWALGQFYNVQPGQYLLKAALLPVSNGYSDYLPTYSEQAIFWSSATPVNISAFLTNWLPFNITMTPGQNPGGPGFIGGLVVEGANLHGGGNEEFLGNGDPQAGISVVLTRADGTPVAATVTDATGHYSFGNLAWGNYIITIDIPGLPLVSTTVSIGPGHSSVSNVNFKVDENSIALPATETALQKTIEVSPNPTQDMLFVDTPDDAELTLVDTRGAIVLRVAGDHAKTKLSLGYLTNGIYFLTVRSAGTIEIVKVIKQ